MKKLLVLVVAAAVIGMVISRDRQPAPSAAQTADDPAIARPGAMAHADATEVQASQPAPAPAAAPAPAEEPKVAQTAPEPHAVATPPLLSAMTLLGNRTQAAPAAAPVPVADSHPTDVDALLKAQALLKAGKRVEARALLTPLYLQATGQRATQLRRALDAISAELVFNPRCTEGAIIHVVAPGEVGVRIAKQFGVNWGMIARLNGMEKNAILHVGQKLKVLRGKPSIVVHRKEFRLTLLWNGAYVKEYAIGTGTADSPTPNGQFVVEDMVVRAPWTNPQGGIVKYRRAGLPAGRALDGLPQRAGRQRPGHPRDQRRELHRHHVLQRLPAHAQR